VEPDGGHVFHQSFIFQLFAGQPTLICAAEVELVAVGLCLDGAEDGAELGQFDFADAMELVVNLLLLELQLLLVWQILPLATAADTEVFTEGGRAYLTILYKANHLPLSEGVLLTAYLHVAHIARHAEGYEHNQFLPVEQALSLSCHSLNHNALKER